VEVVHGFGFDQEIPHQSSFVEQFFLAAAAQNIKRLVRFLSQPTTPMLTATT